MKTRLLCFSSVYSFDGSVIKPPEALAWAKENKVEYVLLSDTTMCGVGEFLIASKNFPGIKALVGLRHGNRTYVAKNDEELRKMIRAYSSGAYDELATFRSLEFEPVQYLPFQKELFEAFQAVRKRAQGEKEKKSTTEKGTENYSTRWIIELDASELSSYGRYDLRANQKLPAAPQGFLESYINSPSLSREERGRLDHEVSMIKSRGLQDYFYTIKRIVEIAERSGIEIGPGRGSAVGSLLLYKMGVTKIDPLAYGLLFERFLNEGRQDLPDVDLDVEDARRAELIGLLREEFGYVYQVGAFSTVSKKSLRNVPEKLAETLATLPLQRTTHASGLIVSTQPIDAPMSPGTHVLEWDMHVLEALGYVKIDLLGLKTLTILKELRAQLKVQTPFNLKEVDKRVLLYVGTGFTDNVFQLDSELAKRICRDVRPTDFSDLAICISLNRPGVFNTSILPRIFRQKWMVKKPLFNVNALRETYGLPIYQEQLMQIATELAGLSLAEADELRRSIAKKDIHTAREIFWKVTSSLERKLGPEGKELAGLILELRNYIFNKSHAVAYAHITYYMAYFKTKYPTVFYDVYLKHDSTILDDAVYNLQALGYVVKPPRIRLKKVATSEEQAGMVYHLPLYAVPGINVKTATELSEREFDDVDDFFERSGLNLATLEALVKVGTFDNVFESRRRAIAYLRSKRSGVDADARRVGRKLFGKKETSDETKVEETWERTHMEYETLGVALTPPTTVVNRLAPYALARSLRLPYGVHVGVKAGFGTDGKSVFKVDVPDGDYTLVFPTKLVPGFHKVTYRLITRLSDVEMLKLNLEEPWEYIIAFGDKPISLPNFGIRYEIIKNVRPLVNISVTELHDPDSFEI